MSCITRSIIVFLHCPQQASKHRCSPSNHHHTSTTLRLTESKSLAGLANNSSLDVLAAEKSVLVRNGLESASGGRVLARAEVVIRLDGVAILLGELGGKRVLDVDEDVALDEGLGACLGFELAKGVSFLAKSFLAPGRVPFVTYPFWC